MAPNRQSKPEKDFCVEKSEQIDRGSDKNVSICYKLGKIGTFFISVIVTFPFSRCTVIVPSASFVISFIIDPVITFTPRGMTRQTIKVHESI